MPPVDIRGVGFRPPAWAAVSCQRTILFSLSSLTSSTHCQVTGVEARAEYECTLRTLALFTNKFGCERERIFCRKPWIVDGVSYKEEFWV